MNKNKRTWQLLAIPVANLLMTPIAVVAIQIRSGIRVTVENTGTTTLQLVVLPVTGASTNLGDIAPGESATTRVDPTGEIHLDVWITDADGQSDPASFCEIAKHTRVRLIISDAPDPGNRQRSCRGKQGRVCSAAQVQPSGPQPSAAFRQRADCWIGSGMPYGDAGLKVAFPARVVLLMGFSVSAFFRLANRCFRQRLRLSGGSPGQ